MEKKITCVIKMTRNILCLQGEPGGAGSIGSTGEQVRHPNTDASFVPKYLHIHPSNIVSLYSRAWLVSLGLWESQAYQERK